VAEDLMEDETQARETSTSGTDVMIFKIFRRKIRQNNWLFLLKLLLVFAKI
jgi:hypothetical protein